MDLVLENRILEFSVFRGQAARLAPQRHDEVPQMTRDKRTVCLTEPHAPCALLTLRMFVVCPPRYCGGPGMP
jgi:hypothetical protein